jgi:predicted GNAT family N-acyltransferase
MSNARIETFEIKRCAKVLEEIQKLRYQVYFKELQIDLPGVDHQRETLPDSLDVPAIHIAARIDSDLVGAVRLNLNTVPKGLESTLRTAGLPRPFVYCSRLYVLEEFRGKGIMQDLAAACFQQFYERGAAVAICHCYPHLSKLYQRMGFRSYGSPFVVPKLEHLGAQTPFRCLFSKRQIAA